MSRTFPAGDPVAHLEEGKMADLRCTAAIIAGKDLRTEFRRLYELVSILAFAAGSMLIAGLTTGSPGGNRPGVVLWITLFFVTILIFTTSFTREADRGTLGGLRTLPCPPMAILAGKIVYGTVLVVFTGLAVLLFSFIFLNLDTGGEVAAFMIVYLLGAVGLSFAGSFVSGLVMFSEGKTMLLSFLLLPVCVPVLVPSVTATGKLAGGAGLAGVLPEIRLLAAFLFVITAIMVLTFSFLLEE